HERHHEVREREEDVEEDRARRGRWNSGCQDAADRRHQKRHQDRDHREDRRRPGEARCLLELTDPDGGRVALPAQRAEPRAIDEALRRGTGRRDNARLRAHCSSPRVTSRKIRSSSLRSGSTATTPTPLRTRWWTISAILTSLPTKPT